MLGREQEQTFLIDLSLKGESLMINIIVIGAGIIGSTVFYELTKQISNVHIFEKQPTAGLDITGHNSAIVHSGVDPLPHTLKAKYNVMGQAIFEQFAQELETPFKRIGAFVVAKSEAECVHLDELEARAKVRNIPVSRLNREQALALEPHLNPNIVSVLDMPTTAIIDPTHLSSQAVKKGVELGGTAHFNEVVKSIHVHPHYFEVTTNQRVVHARIIINCSGLYAQHIESLVGEPTFQLKYRKGEYMVLAHDAPPASSRVIYPVPSPLGKGVLYVPTVSGCTLVGPNAVEVEDFIPKPILDTSMEDIKLKMNQLLTNVPYEYEIDRFVGFRPRVDDDDFVIQEHPHVACFFTVAGIESPGIASAPAIAKDVVTTLILPALQLR